MNRFSPNSDTYSATIADSSILPLLAMHSIFSSLSMNSHITHRSTLLLNILLLNTHALEEWPKIRQKTPYRYFRLIEQNRIKPFFEQHGIVHSTTPRCSSSNGIAKCLNCTILDMARPMPLRSGLLTQIWSRAIETTNKIWNCRFLLHNIATHEPWFNQKPSLTHVRQFGCLVFVKDLGIPVGNKYVA